MSFLLAINKNTKNPLFICATGIKQVACKLGLCVSIFLLAFIFSVYGMYNFYPKKIVIFTGGGHATDKSHKGNRCISFITDS